MTTALSILAQQQGGLLGNPMVMIILMIVMFYFLLIRPQKKQRKEQEARVAALKKGDKVVTIGGMHGKVHQVSKETVTIKISEGVLVPFNKVAIASVDTQFSKSEGNIEEKAPEEASKS
ncbi:MAG: preprotein translocase subunit YajC [Verrucomicrobia bacterium]|jgi:preprotein translocase subunit YajC|nr:preprotein translocase subunit YajC [Verrucomicrobiota bacterium]MDA7607180.1 preprotein translocase subunit YajC [Akkermansiaceae bacterium]MDB4761837.1 preprotein translocase subunit YajC [bacterium]MBT6168003.1 preprotein translocase subunit YajC [Verrucomicrobiota bacterium]MBT7969826.1 preprotein translocase subunit YajC [Verrucomicrobiota bacterium]